MDGRGEWSRRVTSARSSGDGDFTAFTESHAALMRAANFVHARAELAHRVDGATRPRLIGNWFSELNTLLHIALGDAADLRGMRLSSRPSHTAVKLGRVMPDWSAEADDNCRIRALAKSTSCLRYNRGVASYPDIRGCRSMTLGWRGPTGTALRVVSLGANVIPDVANIREVGSFYEALAGRLGAHQSIPRPKRRAVMTPAAVQWETAHRGYDVAAS